MNLNTILVIKKDGSKESFDLDKFHKVSRFACEKLTGVHPSSIEINASKKMTGLAEISTSDITELLIKSAQELVATESTNYQYVAGRLTNYSIRKQVYGTFDVPRLYDVVKKNIEDGWYDPEYLTNYTEEEIDYFNSKLDHSRDEHFTIAAWKQFKSKYLIRDRKAPKDQGFVETPQIAYMLISMALFAERKDRTELIVDYYNEISRASLSSLSLPTPIVGGVRTPTRQFSSCVVGTIDDSLESISEGAKTIVKYISQRAGIGFSMARLRPNGAPIRNGQATHTGILPFIKHYQSATKSCSQGSIRGGASTLYFNIFHHEIEDIITLKNNKGTEENRARHVDYCININEHFYRKAIKGEEYWLFNTDQAPGLYDAFFTDPEEFERLYEKYSKKDGIIKKKVNAKQLFMSLAVERMQTGRIYIHNVDNSNTQTPYTQDLAIYSTNLCTEIFLATSELTSYSNFQTSLASQLGLYNEEMNSTDFREAFGEIALCTLTNVNWGVIKKPEDFEKPCKLAVYALDELLDYQDYPMIAAEIPSKSRRQLGVGVNNLAHFLAKHKVSYGSKEALELVDKYMEAMYYYLTKASLELAKEKGACEWWSDVDFDFIFNKRKPAVDTLVPHTTRFDWDALKQEIDKYGLRHTTLIAVPPSETSSVIINSTNGIEPVRSMITYKGNKTDSYPVVVPNTSLKYDMLWEMDMVDYINTMAIIQKYTDQGISNSLSYNPDAFPDGKVPIAKAMKDILLAQKMGLKSLYYHNTKGEDDNTEDCVSCKL